MPRSSTSWKPTASAWSPSSQSESRRPSAGAADTWPPTPPWTSTGAASRSRDGHRAAELKWALELEIRPGRRRPTTGGTRTRLPLSSDWWPPRRQLDCPLQGRVTLDPLCEMVGTKPGAPPSWRERRSGSAAFETHWWAWPIVPSAQLASPMQWSPAFTWRVASAGLSRRRSGGRSCRRPGTGQWMSFVSPIGRRTPDVRR